MRASLRNLFIALIVSLGSLRPLVNSALSIKPLAEKRGSLACRTASCSGASRPSHRRPMRRPPRSLFIDVESAGKILGCSRRGRGASPKGE